MTDEIRKNSKQKYRMHLFFSIITTIFLLLFVTGCTTDTEPVLSDHTVAAIENESAASQSMTVHFIDVGQGDSALIESDGHYMLIDAGERVESTTVLAYLMEQGVTKLDYVIGTHPHSDHIGALADVIEAFDVGTVIMPEKEHTTRSYEDVLDAVSEKGLTITAPVVGEEYRLGSASFQIIAPNRDYEDNLNNWSIGLTMTNGDNRFVFCGDAGKEAEQDICSNGLDIRGDVLKISHHGSYSSSSRQFMDAVNPRYAVISCGVDNDYGYPHRETKETLKKRGIETYRTDTQGTIVAVSDGTDITWSAVGKTPAGDNGTGAEDGSFSYMLNVNRKKFHLPECPSIRDISEHNRKEYNGSREELISMGYQPCRSCNP